MSSRARILEAVRRAKPEPQPLPALFDRAAFGGTSLSGESLVEQFIASARAGGADVVEATRGTLAGAVRAAYPHVRRVLSAVEGVPSQGRTALAPHEQHDLDLFVCEGVLGVAESGAVWLPFSRLGDRAALFLAEHSLLVLERRAIVPTMHEAYRQIDAAAESFGLFVAGPSKTADIEQSLVVGAHGPTSLNLVLLS